jgi:flagellar assembly protein FliH
MGAVEQRLESEAVELAVAVARKLAPELVSRQPFAEIAALATECFRQLTAAPPPGPKSWSNRYLARAAI